MPIRALLENAYPSAFGPEDIAALAGFEAALSKLGLVDRKDPMTMTVAKLIIELAKNGERDPKKLCDDALLKAIAEEKAKRAKQEAARHIDVSHDGEAAE